MKIKENRMDRINRYCLSILVKLPYSLAIFILRILNWFFQGMLFTSRTERVIKISIDLILALIFAIILDKIFISTISILIIAFIIAHSLNWIFATNIWSVRMKNRGNIRNDNFNVFMRTFQNDVQKIRSIHGAVIFGSLSTGKFHQCSDIDVILFRRHGLINLIMSYLFLFFMRTMANFYLFPLDIYVLDDINDYRLKQNEIPIILYDAEGLVEKWAHEYKKN